MCDSCGVLLVSFVEHCGQAEHNRVAWRWLLSAAGGCCACLSNFVMSAPRLMEDGATNPLPGRGCGKVMRYTCRFAPTFSSPNSGKPKIGSCEPKYGSGLFCSARRRVKASITPGYKKKRNYEMDKAPQAARLRKVAWFEQCPNSARTVPEQCPNSARTVPNCENTMFSSFSHFH